MQLHTNCAMGNSIWTSFFVWIYKDKWPLYITQLICSFFDYFIALAYVCEARPMEVVGQQNQGQVCQFPFVVDGKEFLDCTPYNNANISK